MKTRVIPTNVHAVIDYVTAPVLMAAPNLLGLNGARGSAVAPRVAGAGAALYSALTDYELGVRRVVPMRVHLALDAMSGAALAATPWLSRSARGGVRNWLPHALVGASEVALALTTQTAPPGSRRQRVWRAVRNVGPALAALPPRRRAAVIAVPVALGALAYVGRRRVYQAVAVAADAVEEIADAVEDAADALEDAAEDLADAARERAAQHRERERSRFEATGAERESAASPPESTATEEVSTVWSIVSDGPEPSPEPEGAGVSWLWPIEQRGTGERKAVLVGVSPGVMTGEMSAEIERVTSTQGRSAVEEVLD